MRLMALAVSALGNRSASGPSGADLLFLLATGGALRLRLWLRHARSASGPSGAHLLVLLATGGALWLRSWLRHARWHCQVWEMLWRVLISNSRRLCGCWHKYDVEFLHSQADGEEYAIWWPKQISNNPLVPCRLWVLVPGGMGDGDCISGYIPEILRSGAIDCASEAWCIFHPGGTGGARVKSAAGFTGFAPTHLFDFLGQLGALWNDGGAGTGNYAAAPCPYSEVVVLGFSAGGMLVLQAAQELLSSAGPSPTPAGFSARQWESKCTIRFVAVHSPDSIRKTFELFTQWGCFARLDVPFAIHLWWTFWRMGVFRLCPRAPRWSLPCWASMRRATEAIFSQKEVLRRMAEGSWTESKAWPQTRFEDFECGNFAWMSRSHLPQGRVLRIQNPEDPVVPVSGLDPEALKRCEVWWVKGGGHCMCFGAVPLLGVRLRAWIEKQPEKPVEPALLSEPQG